MVEWTEEEKRKVIKAVEQGTFMAKVIPYEEVWQNKSASTGTNEHDFNKVGPNRIRVITHAALYNDTSSCTFIYIKHRTGTRDIVDAGAVAPLIGEVVPFSGQIILGPEQYMKLSFEGCTNGDDIYAVVSGYEVIL